MDIWGITVQNPDAGQCIIETLFYLEQLSEGPPATTTEMVIGNIDSFLNIDDTAAATPFKKIYLVKPCIYKQMCTGAASPIHTLTVAVCGGETIALASAAPLAITGYEGVPLKYTSA